MFLSPKKTPPSTVIKGIAQRHQRINLRDDSILLREREEGSKPG